jgi:hypothetical protein
VEHLWLSAAKVSRDVVAAAAWRQFLSGDALAQSSSASCESASSLQTRLPRTVGDSGNILANDPAGARLGRLVLTN